MPASVRVGDMCTGHDGFAPRPTDVGSPNHFVNGRPVNVVSSHWVTHCAPRKGCHDSVSASGSPNTFSGGQARCRVGDSIACGSTMAQGSPDVFING